MTLHRYLAFSSITTCSPAGPVPVEAGLETITPVAKSLRSPSRHKAGMGSMKVQVTFDGSCQTDFHRYRTGGALLVAAAGLATCGGDSKVKIWKIESAKAQK